MCDRISIAGELIDNHVHVWAQTPAFAPLARVIETDRCKLIDRISPLILPHTDTPASLDGVRSFLIHYALEQLAADFHLKHFVLFKEVETVRVVLEDSFGISPGPERDEILIPHQNEALRIMVQCIFHRHSKPVDTKDVTAFLQLFGGVRIAVLPDQDRIMRFKSMVWLIYLAIEMIAVDPNVCVKGLEYFRSKFRELLESTLADRIINEDSRKPGFDGGRWEDTLFGWLQGEDRKPFVLKLKRQFNLENRIEHANRFLLAEHRKCVFEQVMSLFC